MRTAQEIFDTVSSHLLKQGRKSTDRQGCLYRSPDGDMCAVGCLIPDDVYRPTMERMLVRKLIKDFLSSDLRSLFQNNYYLLADLQFMHDNNSPNLWKDQLKSIASQYNLQYKEQL